MVKLTYSFMFQPADPPRRVGEETISPSDNQTEFSAYFEKNLVAGRTYEVVILTAGETDTESFSPVIQTVLRKDILTFNS
ncbi:unnamed protein product [Clavelina lepadiformis]|uniref:Uncharacterized protein n=1 Tax=Clavelina lepadiformis TaxID=159417 RepID=A0ABP0FPM7_CLALP